MAIEEFGRLVELIQVPMSDGISLAAVRLPATRSPAPAILILTPYRKERGLLAADRFGSDPLACEVIIADVRGTGGSGGDWDGPHSAREIEDCMRLAGS